MSKVALSGNASGTGTFTIASPNSNTDRTLTLPDATGTIATVEAASLPSGSVIWFAANAAPTGYLKANGATVSRTTYAALFAAIGTTFGAGDGSTTFVLPELRGEFIRGWADGRGVDSGRSIGSFQDHQMQSHSHTFQAGVNENAGTYKAHVAQTNSAITNLSTSAVGGTTNGSENRPRNVALLACIKY